MSVPVVTRLAFNVASGLALALAGASEAANSRTEPQSIRAAAERYFVQAAAPGTTVRATAGRLDDRLTLGACVGELTPFLPAGGVVRARTLVGVRCPDAAGWTIYVPVDVESEAPLLVARRALSRGEVPAPDDLELATRRVPGLATQFLARTADIAGRRLRRPVAAGDPLPADALDAPRLVARGQQVTLVAQGSAVAVRARAVAVEAGGNGDRVRVRNLVSGRLVEGVVQADGTVRTSW